MKKITVIVVILLFVVLACSKKEHEPAEYKLLSAGYDEKRPARSEADYLFEIYVSPEVPAVVAESLAIVAMKKEVEARPTCKRAQLNVHADSIDFKYRRPELIAKWYGTGEPNFEIRRWPKE